MIEIDPFSETYMLNTPQTVVSVQHKYTSKYNQLSIATEI
jgi:hypothetical protein